MRRLVAFIVPCLLPGCLVTRGDAEEAAVPIRVQRAFDDNCVFGGCHDAATAQSGLSLAAGDSEAIIDGSAIGSSLPLVDLGNIKGSYLADKILDAPTITGGAMPPGGGDSEDLSMILGWIGGLDFDGVPECVAEEGCGCLQGLCLTGLVCVEGTCEPGEFPDPPTFDAHVWPIMETSCSCHRGAGSGTSTVLLEKDVAYDNIVDVDYGMRKFIDPGNPRNSQIWLSVTDTGGARMPLNRPSLEGYELQIIREWIEAGAPE